MSTENKKSIPPTVWNAYLSKILTIVLIRSMSWVLGIGSISAYWLVPTFLAHRIFLTGIFLVIICHIVTYFALVIMGKVVNLSSTEAFPKK